jgi:hypothetical protein
MLQLKLLHPEHLIADGVIISFSNWLATGTGRRGFLAGRPLWVIFDRVQRGLSIGSFRFAPRADIPGSASVCEYTP